MVTITRQAKWVLMLALASTACLAQAALQGRDINGNAVAGSDASAVFLYDTDLNITWLRDANVNGQQNWGGANDWANNLVVGRYSDWRLPMTMQPDPSCSSQLDAGAAFGMQGFGKNCTGSEMGHLWHTELGNTIGGLSMYGDIQNF